MTPSPSSPATGMHLVDGFLIAPAPDGLDDAILLGFRKILLREVHAGSVRGVLIDVSRIHFLDSASFSLLADTAPMLALLGAETVFVGFQPGVVAALVDLGVERLDIRGVATLEDGFDLLRDIQARRIGPGPIQGEPEPVNEEAGEDRDIHDDLPL